jgi:small subunit ribosomal protein S8e
MKLGRKKSGGKLKAHRKKKSYEVAGQARIVKLSTSDNEKRKNQPTLGGNIKTVMLSGKSVNITSSKNSENKKTKKVDIKNVIETPSNRFLARQNIITKGTIVETSEGKVRITSRPSQRGIISGVLVE